jgi:hypothetical protein
MSEMAHDTNESDAPPENSSDASTRAVAPTETADAAASNNAGPASAVREIRRAEAGRFAPGVSGNPGGRSRVEVEVRDLAQSHGASAIKRLHELMKSKNERVAVAACEALLNRGFGTPRQSVDLTADVTAHSADREAIDFTSISKDDAVRAYLALMNGNS